MYNLFCIVTVTISPLYQIVVLSRFTSPVVVISYVFVTVFAGSSTVYSVSTVTLLDEVSKFYSTNQMFIPDVQYFDSVQKAKKNTKLSGTSSQDFDRQCKKNRDLGIPDLRVDFASGSMSPWLRTESVYYKLRY